MADLVVLLLSNTRMHPVLKKPLTLRMVPPIWVVRSPLISLATSPQHLMVKDRNLAIMLTATLSLLVTSVLTLLRIP
jgi:hypothetical protein